MRSIKLTNNTNTNFLLLNSNKLKKIIPKQTNEMSLCYCHRYKSLCCSKCYHLRNGPYRNLYVTIMNSEPGDSEINLRLPHPYIPPSDIFSLYEEFGKRGLAVRITLDSWLDIPTSAFYSIKLKRAIEPRGADLLRYWR